MKNEILMVCFMVSLVQLEARMLDMTHMLNKHAHHGQLFRNFSMATILNGSYGASKIWFKANDMSLAEHTGTHMDAPVHSYPRGNHLHEIPYQQLVGPAVVLDVIEQMKNDEDYALKMSDIRDYEQTYGRIPDGSIVFLNTEGSIYYHDAPKYLGTKRTWDYAAMHFPGFSAEVTNWLIKERKIKGIGGDRLSFDIGKTVQFPVHDVIGRNNVFGLENVANVHRIPKRGAMVAVLPMLTEEGTGGPTRIMAFWGSNHEMIFSSSDRVGISFLLMVICIVFVSRI